MREIQLCDAKANLSAVVDHQLLEGKPSVITRHGKREAVVAIVPSGPGMPWPTAKQAGTRKGRGRIHTHRARNARAKCVWACSLKRLIFLW
ncbi:antitoxin (DNA-binding transcriptional repressor) of toxin-antitoxin stability system [Bradyrhizobium sp. USDA 4369]